MREKELRVALVCYGGASMAVYMHGVTREILAAARASRALHVHADEAPEHLGETERVYRDALVAAGREARLRVVVDVIAGASAGGINGLLLARALAHDLSLDPLTALWLDQADVTYLLAEERRAGPWSKAFMRPLLWLAATRAPDGMLDDEAKAKLSLFLRSRWFEPPFDGPKLSATLLRAARAMGTTARDDASLVPAGLPLRLFVTVTDFWGRDTVLAGHDPPHVVEREHRHVLAMSYRAAPLGPVESDFDDGALAGLVFAARATSCFPGAFPPATIAEVEAVAAEQGAPWRDRPRFLATTMAAYAGAADDVARIPFIDGGVLNNKPFGEALAVIGRQPAYRQIDRRVVYIEPDPHEWGRRHAGLPGFASVLFGALSDLPRQQPVGTALQAVEEQNALVRRLAGVVEAARPRIAQHVTDVLGWWPRGRYDAATLGHWRRKAETLAARSAGFAFEAYARLRLADTWEALGLPRSDGAETPIEVEDADAAWARTLADYDVTYRRRRLSFLLRELNLLYARLGPACPFAATDLDTIKRALYEALESVRTIEAALPGSDAVRAVAAATGDARAALLERVRAGLGLGALDARVDAALAVQGAEPGLAAAAHALRIAYLGFPFWDVLIFASSGWRELDEFNEIKIDRISPLDAAVLRGHGAPVRLRSARLRAFAGFFSRADREQDYLLGRMQAAERMIDLICDAAAPDAPPPAQVLALKVRAFHAVLAEEEARLSPAVLALGRLWAEGDGAAAGATILERGTTE
ncbi:patatin-like protein [Zavarzinia sp. CC-PAN008]|uniref:patatin-like protein n=1 Tax=Zavarzinia sp. CC-PAN008 TaxID=3243332 RepID=UPI003F745396